MAYARVSAAEAHRLMREQGFDYLDVRTEQEFELGHPEGAFNIPLKLRGDAGMQDNPDFLASARAAFDRERKLVVGCRTGNRSQTAAELLLADGYHNVIEQRAGFDGARDAFGRVLHVGWQAARLPCAQQALPGRDYAALRRKA